MLLGPIAAQAAGGAEGRTPETLIGNRITMDGSQRWTYGFYPEVAAWQNSFWDYAAVRTRGQMTELRLRERGGEGRAVFVDFWATGCGPCRQGMMESWRLKEKLAGQPVDFVCITSADQSPEQVAADFIAKHNITGRQIRLKPEEWNILSAKYRINGIPHYMIVGRDGRVVDPHCRDYGSESLVPLLLKAAGVQE
mgnify:FL=1|jgi:thiol-disulfide isomerase/thioredoxin